MWITPLTGSASFWSNPIQRPEWVVELEVVAIGYIPLVAGLGGRGRYIESLLDVKLHATTPAGCFSCSVINESRFQERTPSCISLVSQVFMEKRHAYSSHNWNVYAHLRRVWGGHPWLVQELSLYTCTLFGLLYHNSVMKYELKVSNRTQQTIMTIIMQSHGLYIHIE
jgi:hypothetical protein